MKIKWLSYSKEWSAFWKACLDIIHRTLPTGKLGLCGEGRRHPAILPDVASPALQISRTLTLAVSTLCLPDSGEIGTFSSRRTIFFEGNNNKITRKIWEMRKTEKKNVRVQARGETWDLRCRKAREGGAEEKNPFKWLTLNKKRESNWALDPLLNLLLQRQENQPIGLLIKIALSLTDERKNT